MNKSKLDAENIPTKEVGVVKNKELQAMLNEALGFAADGNKAVAEQKTIDLVQSLNKVTEVLRRMESFIKNMD